MDIDATRPEGNAYAIMGQVQLLLKETGRADEWEDVLASMTSGDYDNLCDVAEEVTNGSIRVINR